MNVFLCVGVCTLVWGKSHLTMLLDTPMARDRAVLGVRPSFLSMPELREEDCSELLPLRYMLCPPDFAESLARPLLTRERPSCLQETPSLTSSLAAGCGGGCVCVNAGSRAPKNEGLGEGDLDLTSGHTCYRLTESLLRGMRCVCVCWRLPTPSVPLFLPLFLPSRSKGWAEGSSKFRSYCRRLLGS